MARAGRLLVPLTGFAALAACVPPAPLSVSGTLPPPSTSFMIVGDDDVSNGARQPVADALARHGIRVSPDRPDRIVMVTLADRPRDTGSSAGDTANRGGLFSRGRREVRLAIRFLSPQGTLIEERVATEVVTRNAPPADLASLVRAALENR